MAERMLMQWLFQQSIYFDFATRAEVDTSVNYYRNHETRSHGGAVALTVLF